MQKFENITAFLIHSRNYSNNSKLLDFLTDDFGLIRLVARGIKNQITNIQPFLKLQISYTGKSELKTLKSWEICDSSRSFTGRNLLLMIYINELIIKLAQCDKLNLCQDYLYLLNYLNDDNENNEWQLRIFENKLLDNLGYGIDFLSDINSNNIQQTKKYSFAENQGFYADENGISGEQLILIAKNIMPNSSGLKFLKYTNRARINYLLKGRELKSRKLFVSA